MTISANVALNLDLREPGTAVLRALRTLITLDAYLLYVDANERSIVHRFAMYLQQEMPDLHVDCEYNRDGIEPKQINPPRNDPDAQDTDARTVFPDVIAHVRGTKRNHLIIEFKKSSNTTDSNWDFQKLRCYKSLAGLAYEHALFIELRVGKRPGVERAEWV